MSQELISCRGKLLKATLPILQLPLKMSRQLLLLYLYTDVSAWPSSVSMLSGMEQDVRTPDKLVDDVTYSSDGRHAWLAPILPGQVSDQEGKGKFLLIGRS